MEHEDKRLAWFPAPYLERCDDEEDDEDEVLNGERWTRRDSQVDLDGQPRKCEICSIIINLLNSKTHAVVLLIPFSCCCVPQLPCTLPQAATQLKSRTSCP